MSPQHNAHVQDWRQWQWSPWVIDPRTSLRPDPHHWEMAELSLRETILGQALHGSHISASRRAAYRVWRVLRALLTNAAPDLRVRA